VIIETFAFEWDAYHFGAAASGIPHDAAFALHGPESGAALYWGGHRERPQSKVKLLYSTNGQNDSFLLDRTHSPRQNLLTHNNQKGKRSLLATIVTITFKQLYSVKQAESILRQA
jgi:hypothetical protein